VLYSATESFKHLASLYGVVHSQKLQGLNSKFDNILLLLVLHTKSLPLLNLLLKQEDLTLSTRDWCQMLQLTRELNWQEGLRAFLGNFFVRQFFTTFPFDEQVKII